MTGTGVSFDTGVSPATEAAHRWRDLQGKRPTLPTSTRFMAALTGLSKDTMARLPKMREQGLRLGQDSKMYASPETQQIRAGVILDLRAEGLSVRRIAEETGINRETVRRALRDWRRA
jgi:DNA-binding NarL/FixJ family response regulator